MENYIIVAVIVAMVIIGARACVSHFKGEGGCCGGSELKIKPRRLKNVVRTITVSVDGMSCEHCKTRVENALNEMAGISARVNLKKKEAYVSMDRQVDNDIIKRTIENTGYKVTSIKTQNT